MDSIPFSQACENNKDPIANQLAPMVSESSQILEIGHGTGQHALYLSQKLTCPWYAADQPDYHWMLEARIAQNGRGKILGPFEFKATEGNIKHNIPDRHYDVIFSANTIHIMSGPEVEQTLCFLSKLARKKTKLALYGPFKFAGNFTSKSNEHFDQSLRQQNSSMGIKDFEWLESILRDNHFRFLSRTDLPANNQFLVFENEI